MENKKKLISALLIVAIFMACMVFEDIFKSGIQDTKITSACVLGQKVKKSEDVKIISCNAETFAQTKHVAEDFSSFVADVKNFMFYFCK